MTKVGGQADNYTPAGVINVSSSRGSDRECTVSILDHSKANPKQQPPGSPPAFTRPPLTELTFVTPAEV